MLHTLELPKVRKICPGIVFIAVSGMPERETALKGAGADAFLAKPFDIKDLFNIVQHYVVGDKS